MLPAAGYRGAAPPLDLPDPTPREEATWARAWCTPQAAAWADEPWRWPTVALWCRWSVRAEDPSAPAAVGTVALRLADSCGLTAAGLVENGWRIDEPDEHAANRAGAGFGSPDVLPTGDDSAVEPAKLSPRERLARATGRSPSLERARRRADDTDPADDPGPHPS